ncbi:hypothetical protein GIY62_06465 [Burkholderia plantarii]|uniref:hypothetical protein n=1 Tax=Burkholderia plantarii TaxID=41899 RepID=UPI00272D83E2|nr:hypothetical protein [Burkholderia plantarii]WLE60295.1 hypothetical protein GIY62_06465 [Burkholderia plantarii]
MANPKRTYQTQTPGASPVTATQPDGDVPSILGADTNAIITVGGREVPLAEIVIGAFETSGMSAEEWAAADPGVRDNLVGKQRKEIEQAMAGAAELPSQASAREQAAAAVAARAATRAARQQLTPGQSAAPTLPHRDEVDPAKIAAPVQTQQGWIVPSTPRALPQNFR